eukprot:4246535-Prymnesium_polylepis.1
MSAPGSGATAWSRSGRCHSCAGSRCFAHVSSACTAASEPQREMLSTATTAPPCASNASGETLG